MILFLHSHWAALSSAARIAPLPNSHSKHFGRQNSPITPLCYQTTHLAFALRITIAPWYDSSDKQDRLLRVRQYHPPLHWPSRRYSASINPLDKCLRKRLWMNSPSPALRLTFRDRPGCRQRLVTDSFPKLSHDALLLGQAQPYREQKGAAAVWAHPKATLDCHDCMLSAASCRPCELV